MTNEIHKLVANATQIRYSTKYSLNANHKFVDVHPPLESIKIVPKRCSQLLVPRKKENRAQVRFFQEFLQRDNNSLVRYIYRKRREEGRGEGRKEEIRGFTKAAAISGTNIQGMRGRHRNGSGVHSGLKRGPVSQR